MKKTITITYDSTDADLLEKLERVAMHLPSLPFRIEGMGDIEIRENSIVYNPDADCVVAFAPKAEYLPAKDGADVL